MKARMTHPTTGTAGAMVARAEMPLAIRAQQFGQHDLARLYSGIVPTLVITNEEADTQVDCVPWPVGPGQRAFMTFPAREQFDREHGGAVGRLYDFCCTILHHEEPRAVKGWDAARAAHMDRGNVPRTLDVLVARGFLVEWPRERSKEPRRFTLPVTASGDLTEDRPAVVLDPRAALDNRLTARARTVYGFMCARLDYSEVREFKTWWVAERVRIHRPDASRALTLLVQLGYLVEHPRQHTQGRLFTMPRVVIQRAAA